MTQAYISAIIGELNSTNSQMHMRRLIKNKTTEVISVGAFEAARLVTGGTMLEAVVEVIKPRWSLVVEVLLEEVEESVKEGTKEEEGGVGKDNSEAEEEDLGEEDSEDIEENEEGEEGEEGEEEAEVEAVAKTHLVLSCSIKSEILIQRLESIRLVGAFVCNACRHCTSPSNDGF